MRKKQIEAIPFGKKKVHILGDCLMIDGTTGNGYSTKNARVCIRETEYANYVEGEGWNQKKLHNYYGYYDLFSFEMDLTEAEKEEVKAFLGERVKTISAWLGNDVKSIIARAQEKIADNKKDRTYDRRMDKVIKHKNQIREASERMKQWAGNQMDNYAFYQTKGSVKTATCCKCGGTFTGKGKLHNQKEICPHCKKKIVMKSAGRQQKITQRMRFVRFQKTKYGPVAIESEMIKKSCKGEIESCEMRDVYAKFLEENYSIFQNWQKSSWWDAGEYGLHNTPHGKGRIYKVGLKQTLKGTAFQYAPMDIVADWGNPKEEWEQLLETYQAQPDLEKIIKAGMKTLARSLSPMGQFLKCGNELHEILDLTKPQMRIARNLDFGQKEIRIMRMDPNNILSPKEITMLAQNIGFQLHGILQYTTLRKATTYLSKGKDAGIWLDYLNMAEQEGYNMHDKAVLFPRELNARHDEIVKRKKLLRTMKKEERYEARKKILKKYEYKTKDYVIVIPETLNDIVKEGQELHHCVGNYIDRVADGSTDILFLREKGKEDVPFYTIEVRGLEIIQYRGAYNNQHNNPVPKSIKKFMHQFEQSVLKKMRRAA